MSPRPGSLRSHDGQDFWRGLAVVTLDVGSISIRHSASSRLASAGALPPDQNQRLVAASTRLAGAPPALISADWNGADWNGADWNTECADRIPSAGRLELYELADPYAEVGWFADLIYQCEWDYDEQGRRRFWADRRPGQVLWAGGLHDAAALTRAGWQPTVGRHPDDIYAARGVRRCIDGIRVTVGADQRAARTI